MQHNMYYVARTKGVKSMSISSNYIFTGYVLTTTSNASCASGASGASGSSGACGASGASGASNASGPLKSNETPIEL